MNISRELLRIAKSLIADKVYPTMDSLFVDYGSLFAYFENDTVGVQSTDGMIHWYQYQHDKGGYIQTGSTRTPGNATKQKTSVKTGNPLDGMRKQQAARKVNDILHRHSKGFFTDSDWSGINRIWKDLDDEGIDYTINKSEYQKDSFSGMPTSKRWTFEVNFTNERNKPTKLYGNVVASGAGTVEDPLTRYDIICYVA